MRTIKNNWKVALIVAVGIIAIILLGVFCIQSSQNRAFTSKLRENGVMTKMSDVEAGIIKIGKEKEDARKNVES